MLRNRRKENFKFAEQPLKRGKVSVFPLVYVNPFMSTGYKPPSFPQMKSEINTDHLTNVERSAKSRLYERMSQRQNAGIAEDAYTKKLMEEAALNNPNNGAVESLLGLDNKSTNTGAAATAAALSLSLMNDKNLSAAQRLEIQRTAASLISKGQAQAEAMSYKNWLDTIRKTIMAHNLSVAGEQNEAFIRSVPGYEEAVREYKELTTPDRANVARVLRIYEMLMNQSVEALIDPNNSFLTKEEREELQKKKAEAREKMDQIFSMTTQKDGDKVLSDKESQLIDMPLEGDDKNGVGDIANMQVYSALSKLGLIPRAKLIDVVPRTFMHFNELVNSLRGRTPGSYRQPIVIETHPPEAITVEPFTAPTAAPAEAAVPVKRGRKPKPRENLTAAPTKRARTSTNTGHVNMKTVETEDGYVVPVFDDDKEPAALPSNTEDITRQKISADPKALNRPTLLNPPVTLPGNTSAIVLEQQMKTPTLSSLSDPSLNTQRRLTTNPAMQDKTPTQRYNLRVSTTPGPESEEGVTIFKSF